MDHLPLVAPVTKHAETVFSADDIPRAVAAALTTALTPHRGPVFLDFPLEAVFSVGDAELPAGPQLSPLEADPDEVGRAAALGRRRGPSGDHRRLGRLDR